MISQRVKKIGLLDLRLNAAEERNFTFVLPHDWTVLRRRDMLFALCVVFHATNFFYYRLPQGKSRLGRDQLTSSSGDIFAALCCAMLCYAMHCKKLILYLLQTMHCLAMLWMIVGKAILGLRMTWMEAS